MRGERRPLFLDAVRPTVLYNPHFDPHLSSWPSEGSAIIDAIMADGRWNLIVAPHVRLFESASGAERARWESLSVRGRLLVDTGSANSIDMSYTLAADIYLGDVSSQVYEFCTTPRPCVFVNAHAARWQSDPNYAMWHLGQVVERASEVIPALERAVALQPHYADRQTQAVRRSFGDPAWASDEVAADCIVRRVAEGR